MEIYCKDEYNSLKDLMNLVNYIVFDEEKDGFTKKDITTLGLFSLALNSLCEKLTDKIKKELEEK